MRKKYRPLSYMIILPIFFIGAPLFILYLLKDDIIAGYPYLFGGLVEKFAYTLAIRTLAGFAYVSIFLFFIEMRIDNTHVSGFMNITNGQRLAYWKEPSKKLVKIFLCSKDELRDHVPNAHPAKAIVLYFSDGKVKFFKVHGFTQNQINKIMYHLYSVASVDKYAALIDRPPDVDAMIEFSEDISLPAEIGCRLEHAVGDTVLWGMHKYYSVTEVLPGGKNKGNITFDLSKTDSLHINVGDKIEIRENGRAVGTATVTEIFNEKLK